MHSWTLETKTKYSEPPVWVEGYQKTGNMLNNFANIQIEEYHKQVQQNFILYQILVKNLIPDAFDIYVHISIFYMLKHCFNFCFIF